MSASGNLVADVFATDDGGVIFSWEKDDREASIVMPEDRSIIYYSLREAGHRDAGCIDGGWETVERLARWVETGGKLGARGFLSGSHEQSKFEFDR